MQQIISNERIQIRNQQSFIQHMYREYIDNMITHVYAKKWWGSNYKIMTRVIEIICIPIDYLGPLSAARQEIPPRNPWGPKSRKIRCVHWSCRPKIWQATRQSCCRDTCPISERLEKKESKARILPPQDPTTSYGGTTARPAEEGPDVLCVEMSAKANLPLAQTPPPTWRDARNTM